MKTKRTEKEVEVTITMSGKEHDKLVKEISLIHSDWDDFLYADYPMIRGLRNAL